MDQDIVIIGAGAAGTGAARRLAESGLKVVLLEALARPGGRAWTVQAAGVAIDLGCGYLHSAERNPWVPIAEAQGVEVFRGPTAWLSQYRDLGFTPDEQVAAARAFDAWTARIHETPPASDCAADLLDPADARWTRHIQAISGYVSGDELERISVADYGAYDAAASDVNWRLPGGYGALVTRSLPAGVPLHLDTPVTSVALTAEGVEVTTPRGAIRARAVISTVATDVLAGDAITWPAEMDAWRAAAALLPLGQDEKLYWQVAEDGPFQPETHLHGLPSDQAPGSFYLRPLGKPLVECFLGGAGARHLAEAGTDAAFARAEAQLSALFGEDMRPHLTRLVSSDWTRTPSIGGGYSHALPGHAGARQTLAAPCEGRIFLAGEATHRSDFSTAHGALITGRRAAEEALAALGL
ncbi:flavin monoamine oxidase family protein [Acidimangrovimonas sediminis]|uniref:flavin monoamine oxidase family protein n=1 Tax=Acidimangrovimonas sediminis TaxID=2056283 RepID=UPI000C7F9490|nr:NAD(P)/FAD-dependent oxidoreductase [Acidimangrovimonas sediminis]